MYKEIIFENKLTVCYEQQPHMRSVAFSVWVGTGSRDESKKNNGISHFIEHMVFKGTETRSARQIACEFDMIGGQVNAFTAKDCTCYYTKTLDSDLEKSVEILSDMLLHSLFDQQHIETEKQVVYEEINMYEDDPEELVHDILSGEVWKQKSLGYSILGTKRSVGNITQSSIRDYMAKYYVSDNSIISVVGNFNEENLLAILNKYFGSWKPLNIKRSDPAIIQYQPGFIYKNKRTEQTHLCIGFEGINFGDERSCAFLVLNNIIGGSMSSRLFQNIRENLGLVYSIYSFPTSFRDVGMFSIYAATHPTKANEVLELIRNELCLFCEKGITEDELLNGKNQLKGSYILSLDSTTERMTSIGKYKLITGKVKSTEEILASIEKVDSKKVIDLAHTIFCKGKVGIAVLGKADVSPSLLDKFSPS